MELSHILGLNARNYLYTGRYNTAKTKRIANSKLLTKSVLSKHKLPIPRLYRVFRDEKDIERFKFDKIQESFVVKPNKGLGGEGIIVVEGAGEKPGTWLTAQGEEVTAEDLKLHIRDILEGRFSMNDLPDVAYIEERVRIHPAFERYAYHGTPDIGVIVFNRVPIMAFLRLPTKESGGRANLFQGAVGAGIDLGAGVTTYAIQHAHEVVFMPGTRRKIRGIEIPAWDEVLELAIRCQEVSGLGYMRADIVLQPSIKKPGTTLPKVLELNAQPGLKIQLCNKAGLRRRLERVEGLEVETPEKGMRIAKALFADRNLAHLGKQTKTVGVFETVKVLNQLNEKIEVKAKLDTGAWRTSIDESLAKELGLLRPDNILYTKNFWSALGKTRRPVIGISFYLAGRKIETTASVTDRKGLTRPMLIGRRDLKGYRIEFEG
jgi:alpha-L-glutamate ligase-like protein